jgi:hypothetical protein
MATWSDIFDTKYFINSYWPYKNGKGKFNIIVDLVQKINNKTLSYTREYLPINASTKKSAVDLFKRDFINKNKTDDTNVSPVAVNFPS